MKRKMMEGGVSFGAPGDRTGSVYTAQVRVYATDICHGLICHTFDCGNYRSKHRAIGIARHCADLVDKEINVDAARKLIRAAAISIASKNKRPNTIPEIGDWRAAEARVANSIRRLANRGAA